MLLLNHLDPIFHKTSIFLHKKKKKNVSIFHVNSRNSRVFNRATAIEDFVKKDRSIHETDGQWHVVWEKKKKKEKPRTNASGVRSVREVETGMQRRSNP